MAFSEFTSELCILSYPRLHSVGRVFIICSFSADVEPTARSCVCVPSPGLKRWCIIPLKGEEFSELYWEKLAELLSQHHIMSLLQHTPRRKPNFNFAYRTN